MMFVVSINFVVQLSSATSSNDYNFEDRDFHCSLVKVRGFILDDFDCDNFHCLHILTFDNLCKCPLAKDVENKISMSTLAKGYTYDPDQFPTHH
jgi:hypothetical protein